MVGHDALDAEADQLLHRGDIVDRPDVHRLAVVCGLGQGSFIDNRQRTLTYWDLKTRGLLRRQTHYPQGNFARTCTGADITSKTGADIFDSLMAERSDTDPCEGMSVFEHCDQGVDTGIAFGVNIEFGFGKLFK